MKANKGRRRSSLGENLRMSKKAMLRQLQKRSGSKAIAVVRTTEEDEKESLFRQRHAFLAFFRYFDCSSLIVDTNSYLTRCWDKLIVVAAIAAGFVIPYMAAFPLDENFAPTPGQSQYMYM